MEEELNSYIGELVDKGVSDDDIEFLVEDFKSNWKPKRSILQKIGDYGTAAVGSINRAVGKAIAFPLKLEGAAEEVLGIKNPIQGGLEALDIVEESAPWGLTAGQAVEDFTNEINPYDPNVNETFQQFFEGVGQVGTVVASGGSSAAPALAQTATKALPFLEAAKTATGKVLTTAASPQGIVAGSMNAVPEWEAAKAAGASDEVAFENLIKNYFVGQSDIVPVQNFFSRLNKLGGGKIIEKVRTVGMGGLEEATQEAIQQYGTNAFAQADYDPDRDPLFQVLQSAKVGGLVGLFLPTIGVMSKRLPAEARTKVERKLGEIQADQAIEALPESGAPELEAQIEATAEVPKIEKDQIEQTTVVEAVEEEDAEIEKEVKAIEQEAKKQAKEAEQEANADLAEGAEKKVVEPDLKAVATQRVEEALDAMESAQTDAERLVAYKVLANARHALRQIAGTEGKTRTPPKTPLQKQIDETVGVNRKQDPVVVKDVKTALRQQIQEHYRQVEEGVRTGQKMVNENLIPKVQEALKQANLKPGQVSAILTKVKKTNLFTPGSYNRLDKFISNVVTDSQYSDKIADATKIQKQIKSLKGTPQERTAFRMFSALDPDETNVERFISTGQKILKSKAPVRGDKYAPVNLAEVNDFLTKSVGDIYEVEFGKRSTAPVAEQLNEITAKRAEEAESSQIENLAKRLEMDPDDVRSIMESWSDEAKEAMQKEEALAKADKIKTELKNIAKTIRPQLDLVDSGEISPENNKRLADIKSIDPDQLTSKELPEYIRTVDRIVTNNDFGGTEPLAATGRALQAHRELPTRLKNGKVLNLNWIETGTASVPQALEAIYGTADHASLFSLKSGITDISNAKATGEQESQAFVKMMDKVKAKNPQGFTPESQLRQGIYSELIRYDASVEPEEALKQNKKAIESTIKSLEIAGELEEMNNILKTYAPFKDATSIDQVVSRMRQVDNPGKVVVDNIIDFYKQYKDKVNDYNEAVFNSAPQDIVNYSGERNWMSKLGDEWKQDDLDYQRKPRTKVEKFSSAKKFSGYIPQGKVLDFNLHSKAANQIEEINFRMKADPYRLQVRAFANRQAEVLKLLGAEEDKPKTVVKARRLYERIFNKNSGLVKDFEDVLLGRQYQSEAQRRMSDIMSAAQKFGYVGSLSGLTQAPKQYSVLFSTAINLGRNMPYLAQSIKEATTSSKDFNDFFKDETVNIRGVSQSLLNLGDIYKSAPVAEMSAKSRGWLNRVAQKRFDSWWGGLKPLTASDASAAKISFLAYYKDKLSDLGEKYQGLPAENALRESDKRREARAYAKQMVDKTQVSSNPAELARLVKDKSVSTQLVKAWLLPFGSFRLNKVQRLFSDYRALTQGNAAQAKAAAKDIGGALAESIAFESIAWGLRYSVYAGLRALYREILDLEDEEDKEASLHSQIATSVSNIVVDNLPVLLVEPTKNAFVDGVESITWELYKAKNPDATMKEFTKEWGINPKPKYTGKEAFNYLGAYGITAENMINAGSMLAESIDGDSELTDEQKRMGALAAALTLLNISGLVPADFRNPALKEYSEQKKPRPYRRQSTPLLLEQTP